MRVKLMLLAASGMIATSTDLSAEISSTVIDQSFAGCPGKAQLLKMVGVSWDPRPTKWQDHKALREHLHTPIPEGPTRILFWSFGVHHTSVSFSVIAVRNAQGQWHTNGVGEEGPGLLQIAPRPWGALDRDLSVAQGRKLDHLLADPCLYASPRYQRDPAIVAGGAEQTLEIESAEHHWIGSWFGARTPQEEAVVESISE